MKKHPDTLIIGSRDLSTNVPLRSRFGNSITRVIFRFVTGLNVHDTQTGLRGLPKKLFKHLIELKGERYEYEINMLLQIDRWDVKYLEVPIETIYSDGNKGSHFHPLKDSWRIYKKIFAFVISSQV